MCLLYYFEYIKMTTSNLNTFQTPTTRNNSISSINENESKIEIPDKTKDFIEITEKEFSNLFFKERQETMIAKMEKLDSQVIHLEKVYKRWCLADNILKISSVIIISILTTVEAIINLSNFGLNDTDIKKITGIISIVIVSSFLGSESILIAFTGRNKRIYDRRIKKLSEKKNKSYLYFERVRSDKMLTDKELTEFFQIMNDT